MTQVVENWTVGIDIGCESTKVVLGPSLCEIVRNEVGGHETPTLVAFSGRRRMVGDAASHYKASPNTVSSLNRFWLDKDAFQDFYRFDKADGGFIQVDYDGSRQKFDSTVLMAMFLGKIVQNVQATLDRISSDNQDAHLLDYVLAMPPGNDQARNVALRDAAFAAGLESLCIVSKADCLAAAYQRKFNEDKETKYKTVMVVDMGRGENTVSVMQRDDSGTYKVLQAALDSNLGSGLVDLRLWHHFHSTMPVLKEVTPSSKAGHRLLLACRKLKHLLSQLPEAEVTVENINDADHVLHGSRALLVELCSAEKQTLSQIVKDTMNKAQVESLDSVEVLGGACRVPWVKETILETTGIASLSHSLDDTSVALGAAVLLHEAEQLLPNNQRVQLREAEQRMTALDDEMRKRAHVLNQIEAHILEMRAAKTGKHGSLIPTELEVYLNQAEEWLYAIDDDATTFGEIESKHTSLVETTQELCTDYRHAIKEEADAMEREMEAEAKRAQAENNSDEEDHDNRKLPKKRRMEIVQKNKREANELFGDGNYRHAAARYNKALTHCSKFVDLSPNDVEEVNDTKLSLNLNLALAYLKLDMLDQALRVCNDALAIDSQSAKAFYRRATVYHEKKKWENAYADIQQAANFAPDDKAIQKLQARVELQMKKQKAKEKKMAQKMFG